MLDLIGHYTSTQMTRAHPTLCGEMSIRSYHAEMSLKRVYFKSCVQIMCKYGK